MDIINNIEITPENIKYPRTCINTCINTFLFFLKLFIKIALCKETSTKAN